MTEFSDSRVILADVDPALTILIDPGVLTEYLIEHGEQAYEQLVEGIRMPAAEQREIVKGIQGHLLVAEQGQDGHDDSLQTADRLRGQLFAGNLASIFGIAKEVQRKKQSTVDVVARANSLALEWMAEHYGTSEAARKAPIYPTDILCYDFLRPKLRRPAPSSVVIKQEVSQEQIVPTPVTEVATNQGSLAPEIFGEPQVQLDTTSFELGNPDDLAEEIDPDMLIDILGELDDFEIDADLEMPADDLGDLEDIDGQESDRDEEGESSSGARGKRGSREKDSLIIESIQEEHSYDYVLRTGTALEKLVVRYVMEQDPAIEGVDITNERSFQDIVKALRKCLYMREYIASDDLAVRGRFAYISKRAQGAGKGQSNNDKWAKKAASKIEKAKKTEPAEKAS